MGEKESNVSRATSDDQYHDSLADSDSPAQQEPSLGDVSKTSSKYSSLRIWPAVLCLAGMVVAKMLPSMIENGPSQIWMSAAFGPLLGALLVVGWLALTLLAQASWDRAAPPRARTSLRGQ